MKELELYGYANCCADWRFSELYEEVEPELREALDSGEPFKADWSGLRRIPAYWHLERDGEGDVEVRVYIEDENGEEYDASRVIYSKAVTYDRVCKTADELLDILTELAEA